MASPLQTTESSRLLAADDLSNNSSSARFTLHQVRDSLIRQEDTIVFALIERSRFPRNRNAYDPSYLHEMNGNDGVSLAELFVRESEAVHAKAGRYQSLEEVPFFPDNIPSSLVPAYNLQQVLHPPAASVSVSKTIWNMYFNELLPLFTSDGDDGNYAATVASDLVCLQALSRRIHYGRYVAEVKYRDSPQDYAPAIHSKDTNTLMNLLTFSRVEEAVKKRVEKKGMVFGQNVTLDDSSNSSSCKVDPSVVARLYGEWVIPLTKEVEVDYLLRRLG